MCPGTRYSWCQRAALGLLALTLALPARSQTATNDDLPHAGRSLFDILTTVRSEDGPRLEVPFPFDALRTLITRTGGLGNDGIAETRFPLGRSLQRQAAAPKYFKFPRIVLGVTAAPQAAADPSAAMLLKDRLYIGYQPRAETLEVISYNEQAGRFEFQLVEDYAAGKTPRVLQARRALCLSCHQNGGPIFPQPPWSETPANPAIAARLVRAAGRKLDFKPQDTTPVSPEEQLHQSVAAANRLLHAQRIWTRACGKPWASERCKLGLLSTVLEHRLSGRRSHGQGDFLSRREAEDFLATAQYYVWPDGFEIASPHIADRDPLRRPRRTADESLDPLSPREPAEVLDTAVPGSNDRLIDLLSEPFLERDIRWLEETLRGVVGRVGARRQVVAVPCEYTAGKSEAPQGGLVFTCGDEVPGSPEISGKLEFDSVGRAHLEIDRLKVPSLDYRGLKGNADDVVLRPVGGGRATFHPVDPRTGLRPRTSEGWSIVSLAMTWGADDGTANAATFTMVDDVTRFRGTLGSLTHYRLPEADRTISEGPMRRHDVMLALAIRLGSAIPAWCCAPETALPPPVAERPPALSVPGLSTEPGPAHPSLQAFHRVCGGCHGGSGAMPPNFLFGPSDQQLDAVAACAPRILARLALWETGASGLSPMPPSAALAAMGSSAKEWLASTDFKRIRRFAEAIQTDTRSGGTKDYAKLPTCAPSRAK